MPALLEIKNAFAGYGAIEVLKDVSLEIQPGEIVTIIGANGAGKTTTLMCISGVNRLRCGNIMFEGRAIHETPPHEIVRLGLCQSPEGRKIFPRLTVLENLELGAITRNDPAAIRLDLDHAYSLFPILRERSKQLGGTLSGGEQQMLAVARADVSSQIASARRTLARPGSAGRGQNLRGHPNAEPGRHRRAARRTKRPHGVENRPPRLRSRNRPHYHQRTRRRPAQRPPRQRRLLR